MLVRALLRRAGWNLLDQIISSATNVALSFLVARNVDPRGYGAFAVGFIIFTLLIGVGRALVGQPLNIRYSSAGDAGMHDAVARSMGTIIVVTVPVAGRSLSGLWKQDGVQPWEWALNTCPLTPRQAR